MKQRLRDEIKTLIKGSGNKYILCYLQDQFSLIVNDKEVTITRDQALEHLKQHPETEIFGLYICNVKYDWEKKKFVGHQDEVKNILPGYNVHNLTFTNEKIAKEILPLLIQKS